MAKLQKNLASINAKMRLLVPKKVSEDDKLIEYDALLLDRFLGILQGLHGDDVRETVIIIISSIILAISSQKFPFSQSRLSCDRRMESSSVLAVSSLVIGEMEYSAVLAVLAQITDTKTRLQKNAEENQKVDFRSLAVPRTISNTRTQFQKNTEENQNFFSRIQTAG
ncbi:unnamed protein product [Sphagnum jensenii]